jgi:hypothetical protein
MAFTTWVIRIQIVLMNLQSLSVGFYTCTENLLQSHSKYSAHKCALSHYVCKESPVSNFYQPCSSYKGNFGELFQKEVQQYQGCCGLLCSQAKNTSMVVVHCRLPWIMENLQASSNHMTGLLYFKN